MHYITKKHLSRRALLRGAGAALSLPLLESMIPAATALENTAAAPRMRVGFIYLPHGAIMNKWTPATVGSDFEFTPILKPLEKFRHQLNIISGTALPNAYGADGSAGANHTRSSAVFLAGAPCGNSGRAHLAVTADQLIAKKIGQDTPLPSLELCVEDGSLSCGTGLSCAYRNTICWQSEYSPLPMENNPQVTFERLFGDGSTDEERTARREQARSLLDSMVGEVAKLQKSLPASDRERLDRYLTDIREIERRIQMAGQQIPADLAVPEKPIGIPDDFEEHINLLFDLQVLAWQAEITRVTSLMFAKEVSNAVYPNSGIRDPFHNLSHHSNVPENMEKYSQLNAYHHSIFGKLLEKLEATPDGDSNLLVNSMIMFGSGMSNSNQHDHEPLPIIVAGNATGKLQGNRHIHVDNKPPLSNVLLSMLHTAGVDADSFGDSTGTVAL